MPDYSFYSTGTATVANGSTAVTFQGSGAIAAAVRVGDMFGTHRGRPIRIAAIAADNTGLTLANPWPEASQTAAPYEIQHTPYDAGLPQQLQKIIDRLTSGNVSTFADLEGEADLLPYFTGAGTMALAAFTEAARDILRGEGRLGLAAEVITDWHDVDGNGWWQGNGAANAPGTGWWLGRAMRHTENFISIEATDFVSAAAGDTRMWRLDKQNGVWGSWYRIRYSEAELDGRYARKFGDEEIAGLKQFTLGEIQIGAAAGSRTRINFAGHISRDGGPYYELWHDGNNPAGIGFTGWKQDANGFIEQWGRYGGGGDTTINFPVSFPNNILGALMIFDDAPTNSTEILSCNISAKSIGGMTIRPRYYSFGVNTGSVATQPIFWRVWGN